MVEGGGGWWRVVEGGGGWWRVVEGERWGAGEGGREAFWISDILISGILESDFYNSRI